LIINELNLGIFRMYCKLNHLVLAGSLLIAGSVQADIIDTDLSETDVIPGVKSYQTSGDQMDGMISSVQVSDGSSQQLTLTDLNHGGGVKDTNWSLLQKKGDTFSSDKNGTDSSTPSLKFDVKIDRGYSTFNQTNREIEIPRDNDNNSSIIIPGLEPDQQVIPEPNSILLLTIGLLAFSYRARLTAS
jgi:hypothetical protein